MENGYYTILIHGWLEFFKVENGKIFGLETGKKAAWFPTLMDPKRELNLQPATIDNVKLQYPEFVTQNQKATDEDILASVKTGFAEKRMK